MNFFIIESSLALFLFISLPSLACVDIEAEEELNTFIIKEKLEYSDLYHVSIYYPSEYLGAKAFRAKISFGDDFDNPSFTSSTIVSDTTKTKIDLKSSQTNLVKKTKTASSKQKEMNLEQLLNKEQESEFTVKSNTEHIKSEEVLSIENRLKKDGQNDLRIKVRNFVQGAKNKAGNSGLQLLTG